MKPFWALLLGSGAIWLINSGVLTKLVAVLTGPAPAVSTPAASLPPNPTPGRT